MEPRYMDNLKKNTFKPCTPTMKKKRVRSKPIEFGQFAKCWKRTRLGGEISLAYDYYSKSSIL